MISLSQSVSREGKKKLWKFIAWRWARPPNWEGNHCVLFLGWGAWEVRTGQLQAKPLRSLWKKWRTRDGWLLLFPAGVWHSCYQKHFNWLANCMVTWKISLRKWLCRLFSHFAGKCWDRVVAECQDFSGNMCELSPFFSSMCTWYILHKSSSFALTGNKATVESVGLIIRSLSS